jgi:hypothetical protein
LRFRVEVRAWRVALGGPACAEAGRPNATKTHRLARVPARAQPSAGAARSPPPPRKMSSFGAHRRAYSSASARSFRDDLELELLTSTASRNCQSETLAPAFLRNCRDSCAFVGIASRLLHDAPPRVSRCSRPCGREGWFYRSFAPRAAVSAPSKWWLGREWGS